MEKHNNDFLTTIFKKEWYKANRLAPQTIKYNADNVNIEETQDSNHFSSEIFDFTNNFANDLMNYRIMVEKIVDDEVLRKITKICNDENINIAYVIDKEALFKTIKKAEAFDKIMDYYPNNYLDKIIGAEDMAKIREAKN